MVKTTAVDRLIFTLLFSVIIHLVIVLGISFDATSPPTNEPLANLEITLVKQQTELLPEQADFLAQVNNEGGGETEQKSPEPSPETLTPVIDDVASLSEAPTSITPPLPEPVPQPEPQPVIEIPTPEPESVKAAEPAKSIKKPPTKPAQIMTQAKAERKIVVPDTVADKLEVAADVKPPAKLSASELIFQAKQEIQRLEEKLYQSAKTLSKKPKKRRISAATKEYAAAAYMKAWEMKVERIGNINYPQEAKRLGINGSLMLSVDINPDGSVPPDGIVVSRKSGHAMLDAAAVKIVRLGAPYSDIPENVLQGNDMLTIIRTWKFETNQGLSTR
ncbi:MAG: energy transducer TonB [Methylophaga sp.]|nr:MAG: energy transducer TonB [Methylophaga sp.]